MPAMLFSAQGGTCPHENPLTSQVFTMGMPALPLSAKKATEPSMPPVPKSVSAPSNLEILKEFKQSSPLPSCQISITSPNSLIGNHCINTCHNEGAQLINGGNALCIKDMNVSFSQVKLMDSESGSLGHITQNADIKDSSEQFIDAPAKAETVAETSLPWRRQTSLPPVPSSVSSSLPDDENPLMSEVPSWAGNLAYNHLTESGSPYCSPQNTVTSKPEAAPHRPVFELFPLSSPQPSSAAGPSIPPPWSIKVSDSDAREDEPIPSQSVTGSDAGDKANCLLMSAHDHVPPVHHSCLQPSSNGSDAAITRRHSDFSSPIHFQLMQKPDAVSAADLETELIGIEEDYQHGMADRVSRWLASSNDGGPYPSDADYEIASRDVGQRIIESLKQKSQWSMEERDDGTEADVESNNDVLDTKL